MIEAIYWLAIFAVVLVNVTALTLLTLRYIPFPAIARTTGILLVCLALFSLEHFVGLGELYPLFLPLTALSLYVIWLDRARFLDENFRTSELVFVCALLFGAVWRLTTPDIVEDNDRLSDFHLVSNYLLGERLPPIDNWLPHQRLNYYYAFQHYAAALFGRLFGLGPGASFNLAAVILSALVLALAWEFLTILRVRLGLKLLSVAALAIGGIGVSPLFHLITSPFPSGFLHGASAYHDVLYNSRFIGWFETSVSSDAWRALFGETQRANLLPIETFGYQYALGGYHAVLSGFLLLFLALTIMVATPTATNTVRDRLEMVLGLTLPLTLCSNAWVFPLQAALIGAWTIWNRRVSGQWNWYFLAIGAAAGVFLLLPFLAGFGPVSNHMRLQLVSLNERAPIAQFLMIFWPLIVLAVAVPIAGLTKSLAGFLAALFLGLLVFTELFNFYDGGYSGEFARFNGTLKWWGWIFTGGVFAISAFLLASDRRAVRMVAVITLALISVFAIDTGRLFAFRGFTGKIDGSRFYAQDLSNARMMEYLANAPRGIVLEKVYEDRPVDTGIYGSFAVKPSLVGVPWILNVWKRDLTELPGLIAGIKDFYAGNHAEPARFLTDHNVRYVVWSIRESRDVDTWNKIADQIGADFHWLEFSRSPDAHIGLWIRR
jgi:hypothetical protein